MPELKVYGHSDDLIELDGIKGADEFSKPSGAWVGVLEAPNGDTALLYVDYRHNGCWTASLGIYEEGYKLPEWPVTVTTDAKYANEYSTLTTITVPEGTTVRECTDE
jgi:hypothetical protein